MIENERKYIIELDHKSMFYIAKTYNSDLYILEQGYVGEGRIRSIKKRQLGGYVEGLTEYVFTWKRRRDDGSQLEIETNITTDDFNELWEAATNRISKTRVKISGYNVDWDIDFLFDEDGEHYLTIAEVEMPEGWDTPKDLPSFVEDNLLFLVGRNEESTWTNKKLSDPEKVKQMVRQRMNNEEKDRG